MAEKRIISRLKYISIKKNEKRKKNKGTQQNIQEL